VPATGTAALLNQSNSFTQINPLVTISESWIGPSATAGVYFKADNVGIGNSWPVTPLHVVYPFAKTDTTERKVFTLSSNEAGFVNAFRLYFKATGHAASSHLRVWSIQTGLSDVNNNGILALQSEGGSVSIGTDAPGAKLDVLSTDYPVMRGIRSTALTNISRGVLAILHRTSADMVDGFGTQFAFQIQDATSAIENIAAISAVRDGADDSGRLSFDVFKAGVQNYAVMQITSDGNVLIGATSDNGQLTVDQSSATGAKPVLFLDQGDDDEPMIEFAGAIGVGNVIEAVGGKTLTVTHYLKCEINGVGIRYLALGTIA